MKSERTYQIKRSIGYGAVAVLEGALRLAGSSNYQFIVERLHQRMYKEGFDVDGVQYYPDPSSVGKTPQGRITGESAADLVRSRGLSDIRVLDVCCGVGIVGFTMLAQLKDTERISEMSFADINIFNVNSVKRTLENNDESRIGKAPVHVYLSDGLRCIEPASQFDVIVSNPPHFDADPFPKGTSLDPVSLGNSDPAWDFHRGFYEVVDKYLRPEGEVWFFENGEGASVDLLLPFIEQNPDLEFIESFPDRRDSTFFWMITRRRPD